MARFALLAVLYSVLVVAFADAIGARRRQRELLALLAHGDPKVPGALVIDYPAAAAYCLPGIRSQIVVSVGTLDLLAPAELTAVLAHERAHLRARHDLVLIPFTSLRRAFPRLAGVAEAHRTVALLVQTMADDRALRFRGLLPKELATALVLLSHRGRRLRPRRGARGGRGRADRPGAPAADAAAAAVAGRPGGRRPDGRAGRGDAGAAAGHAVKARSRSTSVSCLLRSSLDFEFDLPGTVRAVVGRAAALELADLRPGMSRQGRPRPRRRRSRTGTRPRRRTLLSRARARRPRRG